MALDEALLAGVGDGSSPPTIRLYGFNPPTLSVGRFQRVRDVLLPEALARDGVGFVRRPTGGHAVLHDDELTYAVCFSRLFAERELGGCRKRTVYMFVARLLASCLEALGVKAAPCESREGDLRNPDCFASTGEYEIRSLAGRKLIGSAQVTSRTGVLQHGSIPIGDRGGRVAAYLSTEPLPDSARPSSLLEETGRRMPFEEVRDSFARHLRQGFEAEDGAWSDREKETAERLLADRYSRDEWNLQH